MSVSLRRKAALLGAALSFLAGCATMDGRDYLRTEAPRAGFVEVAAGEGAGRLQALLRGGPGDTLVVYLEGDGAAWPSRWRPPTDPTPDGALVMELAAADPAGAVAYLGRPCQFLADAALAACSPELWTRRRFAPEAVAAMDGGLDRLKAATGARRLRLIGHSGGGVMALLLAARRTDVVQVTTIAAPVRVGAWTHHHGVTPLAGDDPDTLPGPWPPAVHFVGEKDDVVPPAIVAPFAARTGGRLVAVPGFDHRCCWSRDWRRLLENLQ